MAFSFSTSYVTDSIELFHHHKKLAERAIDQLPADHLLHTTLDSESNSIAVIIQHMAGNMRSRFTEFLTTDGEKPDRHRDREFENSTADRAALLEMWEQGWTCVFSALEPLTEDDLARPVLIRGEKHSVMQAINRQIAHYSYHCGQIVFLAKHLASANWQALTVSRGKSEEFNRRVQAGELSQR